MRFESPWLLLALAPVLVAVAYGLWRTRARSVVLRFPTLATVRAARPAWWGRWHLAPRVLQGAALVLAVVALARPQVEDTSEITGEGADFVIALDMSGSMNAVDLEPERIIAYHQQGREPPNRFEAAREVLRRFIADRAQDRIGLVIFSSKAWVKFPLTLDRDAMLRILDGLVLDDGVRGPEGTCLNGCTITGEATAIGDALGRAYKRVEHSDTRSRNIILITDGDNNAGSVAPEEVAKFIASETKDRPVRVFTFLAGTGENTFMPARNPFTGQPILTPEGFRVYEHPREPFPVNPALLKAIAEATGGSYHEAATEDDFRREFESLEKTAFRTPALQRWREAYLAPVGVAAVLALLGEVLGLTVFRRWP